MRLSLEDMGRLIGDKLLAFRVNLGIFELVSLGELISTKLVDSVEKRTCGNATVGIASGIFPSVEQCEYAVFIRAYFNVLFI